MVQTTIKRVGFFLFYRQYEIGDILLGILGILWGLWVANPLMDTLALESYAGFISVVPEWVWGIGMLVLGIFTLTAAVCKHRYYFRAITLLLNVLIWSFISFQFLMGAPANTGFVVYLVVALDSVWAYLRLTIFTKMIDFSSDDLRAMRKFNGQ